MRSPVVPAIPEVRRALETARSRAALVPGTWARVRTSEDGRLDLAWRIEADGTERLALGRDGGPPTPADLDAVYGALPRELRLTGELITRQGSAMVFHLVISQLALAL